MGKSMLLTTMTMVMASMTLRNTVTPMAMAPLTTLTMTMTTMVYPILKILLILMVTVFLITWTTMMIMTAFLTLRIFPVIGEFGNLVSALAFMGLLDFHLCLLGLAHLRP